MAKQPEKVTFNNSNVTFSGCLAIVAADDYMKSGRTRPLAIGKLGYRLEIFRVSAGTVIVKCYDEN